MKKRNVTFIVLLCAFSVLGQTMALGQITWYDPLKHDTPVIQNQGWPGEIGRSYQRLPQRAEEKVRKPVWNLSLNATGLALHFYTNAELITVRYGVASSFAMPHMPATGKSGVDLYAIDSDGKWRVASGRYNFEDTITYTYTQLSRSKYHGQGFEYRLFLPLYNSVEWMEIGVPDSAQLSFIPRLKEKPIVVYGTSIAQGGCASRPGMGWTNILSRKLDLPVINLGFSGNGPLEKEMVDLISELDVALVVFDCLPNMGSLSDEEVKSRTAYGVSTIKEKLDIPVLIVDHIGYRNDQTNRTTKEAADRLNRASKEVYDSLKQSGMKELYYLSKEDINFPEDGCVDNIHPNDLGMQAYGDAYEKSIRRILRMPVGSKKVTQPVSQRREPYIYEWKKRHHDKLGEIELASPQKVIIGNSITHYWNDEEGKENGPESWQKYMEPRGFLNLGYGWDRIENVLWRVYHGELDGFEVDEVVLMIGTNNLGLDNSEEIVEGLEFLLKQIKQRQPKATLKVVGLLPRRDKEEEVDAVNRMIEKMANRNQYTYIEAGKELLKHGKIVESYFTDGLHPNEKGYSRIAPHLIR